MQVVNIGLIVTAVFWLAVEFDEGMCMAKAIGMLLIPFAMRSAHRTLPRRSCIKWESIRIKFCSIARTVLAIFPRDRSSPESLRESLGYRRFAVPLV
jgi:hypothetical protein